MKYTVTKVDGRETSTGKKYLRVTLVDEEQNETENVSIWSDFPLFETISFDSIVDGEIVEKNGFKNLKAPYVSRGKGNMAGVMAQKTESIAKAQDRKEKSIFAAQDRSSWMWARNNAAMLIANSDKTRHMPISEQFALLEDYATKIYNSEPITPFNE